MWVRVVNIFPEEFLRVDHNIIIADMVQVGITLRLQIIMRIASKTFSSVRTYFNILTIRFRFFLIVSLEIARARAHTHTHVVWPIKRGSIIRADSREDERWVILGSYEY